MFALRLELLCFFVCLKLVCLVCLDVWGNLGVFAVCVFDGPSRPPLYVSVRVRVLWISVDSLVFVTLLSLLKS